MDRRDDETAIVASASSANGEPRSEMLSDMTKNFSLVSGGPFYQFLVRIGLVKEPLERVVWRAVIITLVAWLPLLLLAMLAS